MSKTLFEAVYGRLIGGAIGDALGAPVEGWYFHEIRSKYGKMEHFMPFDNNYSTGAPGCITDDTTLRHYLCLAIIEKGGRVTPDDFARMWLKKLNPKRLWTNERIVLQKLQAGMNPWDSGRGTIPAGCATMAIAPIGIVNIGDPEQAYQDAFNIASLNQDGVDRDAAATVAAAVAYALLPDATVEGVLETMFRCSSFVVKRALLLTMDLAYASRSVDEFAEKFYQKMLDWTWPSPPDKGWNKDHYFSGSSLEIVPVAAAILYLCKGEVNSCIIEGASFGRDCDTIANVVGHLAGALRGASAIREDWIKQCEEANREFFEEVEGSPDANFRFTAERLVQVIEKEGARLQERLHLLERLFQPERGVVR